MTTLFASVGSPGSVGPTSGGKFYAFNNLGTSPQVVAPSNASRTQITFHNPGTVDIFVAPQFVVGLNAVPASPTNQALTPSTSLLGGCWRVYANGGSTTFSGECQGQFQAFAASGSNQPLTVIDTNQ